MKYTDAFEYGFMAAKAGKQQRPDLDDEFYNQLPDEFLAHSPLVNAWNEGFEAFKKLEDQK